jgi:hypothetical protein
VTNSIPGGRVAHEHRGVTRAVAGLMLFEAATLAVASALHLSGNVQGRSAWGRPAWRSPGSCWA